ncbi:MAG: hypothetical protein WA231_17220 [Methylocella sp.]
MQLADRKNDAYWHVFETVVSDCLEEGLVGGLDFTVDVLGTFLAAAETDGAARSRSLARRLARCAMLGAGPAPARPSS